MSVFKEIKRRAHNVVLAATGKGLGWQEKLEPVKIRIESPLKIETYQLQHSVGPFIEGVNPVMLDRIIDNERKSLAKEIGLALLKEGFIYAETIDTKVMGAKGVLIRMEVKVVTPEEKEAKP